MYRTSAKTVKITDAKKLLSKYLGEVVAGTFKGFHDDALSMQEVFDDFADDCRRRKLRGIDRIVSHIRPLRAWFGKMDATHVSERDIDRYIKARQKAGRSNTTINRELQYLGQSMRRPRTRSLLPTSP